MVPSAMAAYYDRELRVWRIMNRVKRLVVLSAIPIRCTSDISDKHADAIEYRLWFLVFHFLTK
jgi:hypothetical protein